MQRAPYGKRSARARLREVRLRELGYDTYAAYLRSAAWRDVKARYRASDLPQICMCGETKVDLHHTTYDRVGREELDDLVPLCRDCHTQAHVLEADGVIELDLKGFYYDTERAAINRARRLSGLAETGAQVGIDNEQVRYKAAQQKREAGRRPWNRPPETPEQRDARRARVEREAQRRREPTEPRAARVSL